MGSHTEKGIIVEIGAPEKKTEKMTIQKLVIRTADQYPEYIVFEAVNDRCELLKSLFVNEVVTVYFDMKGRPWKSPEGTVKYFQSNSLWKIEFEGAPNEPLEDEQTMQELGFDTKQQKEEKQKKTKKAKQQQPHNGRIDDLPF